MKRRVLAIIMGTVMAAGLLMTGCGGGSEAPAEATEAEDTTEEAEVEEEAEDTAAEEGGITFADLQNNYALLTDAYNAVEEAYKNDAIKQSDEVEQNLAEAKEVMDQMGELSEDDFQSQEDMETINNSMLQMCDVLNAILDKMEGTNGSPEDIAALKEAFPVGYAGAGDDGSEMYWAMSEDASQGMLVVVAADKSDAVSFVGAIVDNGDGSVTVTDDQSGAAFTVFVEASTDDDGEDCVVLTTEDGSKGVLYQVPGENVIDALNNM